MKTRIDQEKDFWDSFAAKYDNFMAKTASSYHTMVKSIKEELTHSDHLLEVATGTGIISFEIYRQVSKITAIDISPEMIHIAKNKLENHPDADIDFLVGDICDLDFPDRSFDVIIASNVLHLLFDPEQAISEMKRVLKSEGKIILPTYCHGENLKSQLISRIMGLAGFRARTRWSQDSYKKFITDQNLVIRREEHLKDKIPLSYVVATRIE